MRFKRLTAFILALAMLAGNVSGAYADDTGTADMTFTGEVSGNDYTGSFPFDVSADDISGNESEENNEITPDETVEEPDVYEEESFSGEEGHGIKTKRPRLLNVFGAGSPKESDPDYYTAYYNQIGEPAQALYKIIETNLDKFADPSYTVDVNFKNLQGDYSEALSEELKNYCFDGFAAFDYDHPEVFWLRPSSFAFSLLKSSSTGKYVGMRIKLSSTATSFYQAPYDNYPVDILSDKAQMEAYISEIVEKTKTVSDYSGKIKIINDELSNFNYYNRYVYRGDKNGASLLAWEAASALISQPWIKSDYDNGSEDAPVCEGYARAFKLICDRIGIPAIVVVGANHMWNYVQDPFDTWYAVDVTWDDPVTRSNGTKEWLVRETPLEDIDKYVLVGSETIINGASFSSRHPADGAFWRNGNVFDVPTLSETAYSENVVVENATFFVGARDSENAVISLSEISSNEEDKYFRDYSDALTYALELSSSYPDKNIILQLNRDFVFAENATDELRYTNIVLSTGTNRATFSASGHFNLSNVKIKAESYTIRLTGNLTVDYDMDAPTAEIDQAGYITTISDYKKCVLGKISGGAVCMKKGAKLILLNGESSIAEVLTAESEDEYPYILISEDAKLSIEAGISVENDGLGKVNMGILESGTDVDSLLSLDYDNLPLSPAENVLFKTERIMDYSTVINPLTTSVNDVKVVFENGYVLVKEVIYHLYIVNEEGTEEYVDSYESLSNAFKYINTTANLQNRYLLKMSGNGFEAGNIVFPGKLSSLRIVSENKNELKVTGNITFSKETILDNLIISGNGLVAKANLILVDTDVYLSGNLSVKSLDMTDSTIVAGGTVSIESLISRTDSNSILYGDPATEYITYDRAVSLYRDTAFAGSFASLQKALDKITTISAREANYVIKINDDAATSGKNIVFPPKNKASSIKITSEGAAKPVRYRDSLEIDSAVTFENVILRPQIAETQVSIKSYSLTLMDVTMTLGSSISSVTGSGTEGKSKLILSGNTDIEFGKIDGVGCFSVVAGNPVTVKKDLKVGILDISEDSTLITRKSGKISSLYSPNGSWYVYVSSEKNKEGLISATTAKVTVANDFITTEGNGLTIIPIDTKGKVIAAEQFSPKALCGDKLRILNGKQLSTGIYRDGAFHPSVVIGGSPLVNTAKAGSKLVMSSKNADTYLVFDDDRAVATVSINGAVKEINLRKTKKAYTIIPGDNGKILSEPLSSKAVSSIELIGGGRTVYVKNAYSYPCDLTLKDIYIVHERKTTFKNLNLDSGSRLYALGKTKIKNVYDISDGGADSGVITQRSQYTRRKTNITITGRWSPNKKCRVLNRINIDDAGLGLTREALDEKEFELISGLCRDEKGVVCLRNDEDMQIKLTDSQGNTFGLFKSFSSAVKYIDNRKSNTTEYVINLQSSASSDGTIYMDGISGNVNKLVLPIYAKEVRITTTDGEPTAYLAFKTGSFVFKRNYKLIFDRVNLLEEKTDHTPSTGAITVENGTLAFTENVKTCQNGSFKSTVFCKKISCPTGTLVLGNIGLEAREDANVNKLSISGETFVKAMGKTKLSNISGAGTVYVNRLNTGNLSITGTVKNTVSVGVIPYVKNSVTGLYENAENGYIKKLLYTGTPKTSKKFVSGVKAGASRFFICDENKTAYIVDGKEVGICKVNSDLYVTTIPSE